MTPQEAMRLAETSPKLTTKERQKVLALALMQIAKNGIELAMLWGFSQMVASAAGYEIPALDSAFIADINENPAKYHDYR